MILSFLMINIVLFIVRYGHGFMRFDNSSSGEVGLSIFCENVPGQVLALIKPGDTQNIGGRELAKVISVEGIRKNPFKGENVPETYSFALNLSVSRNLLRYTTLRLFSPVAFETKDYRIDGELLEIRGD